MKYFKKSHKNQNNPNFLSIGKGKYAGKFYYEDTTKALTYFYKKSKELNFNYRCICIKSNRLDYHRLFFDVDDSYESTDKIFDKINMLLTEHLLKPDLDAVICMNIGKNHKRHFIYPNIIVNNSIRKSLVKKINERFTAIDENGEKERFGLVDDNVNSGLRVPCTNKFDTKTGKFEENTRYVKEDGTDLTLEEFIGDYNIFTDKKEVVGIADSLIEEVQKKQKVNNSSCNIIDIDDLPEWARIQYDLINDDIRFTDKIQDIKKMNNSSYVLNLKQGSFICPFVNRIHTSNRNRIYIYPDPKKSYLCCHKCVGKKEYLNLDFNRCLIEDDDIDEEELFKDFFLKNTEIINNTIWNGGDLQMGNLCKRFYRKNIICINTSKDTFYVWNDKIKLWIEDRKGCYTKIKIAKFLSSMTKFLLEKVKKELDEVNELDTATIKDLEERESRLKTKFKTLSSHTAVKSIMKMFTSLIYDENFEKNLNRNRRILSITDGVIDLQTGLFRERTRADMLNYRLERYYEKPDLTELGSLGTFLNESFKDKGEEREEMIEWLQKFLGYCLTGEVKEQLFCIWLGTRGGNGKSLLCGLMAEIMEKLYTNLSSSDVIKGGRNDCTKKLFGKCIDKRMGVLEEIDQKSQIKEVVIKDICGQTDTSVVNCKQLYKDEMDCYMYVSIVLNTNYKINADPTDDAFWRRVQVVPFDRYFRSIDDNDYNEDDDLCGIRDDDLIEKIQLEDKFFYWVIEGARKYYDTGLKKIPSCMKNAKSNLRNENDPLADFIDNHCETNEELTIDKKKWISCRDFHKKYVEENGKIDIKILGSSMKKKGYTTGRQWRIIEIDGKPTKKKDTIWKNLEWFLEDDCLIDDED